MANWKDPDRTDDVKESIALLDQVTARISRSLADLAAPKAQPAPGAREASSGEETGL